MFRHGILEWAKVIRRFAIASMVALALWPVSDARSQDTPSSSSPADEQLVAAERALLEGLSSNGVGAFDGKVAPAKGRTRKAQSAKDLSSAKKEVRSLVQAPPLDAAVGSAHQEAASAATTGGGAPTDGSKRDPQAESAPPPPQAPAATPPRPDSDATRRQLEASQRRVTELERELEEVRGQLTMAETELSRLASIAEAKSRASLGKMNLGLPAAPVARATPSQSRSLQAPPLAKVSAPAAVEPTPSAADLMIVTVDVEKAELRLGPGTNHSSLMTVARGSRLAVEARQGEWYRVFAPNGQRAWILSRLVTVGEKSNSKENSSSVRVRGYSSSLEDEAFQRIQSLTGERK